MSHSELSEACAETEIINSENMDDSNDSDVLSAGCAPPLEFFFQEQSYSSLHSGWSLAWDHVRGDIDDPCGAITDFCGVIADPCGGVTIP